MHTPWCALAAIAIAIVPARALAQHCHVDPTPRPTTTAPRAVQVAVGTRLTVGVAAATSATTRMEQRRGYQGGELTVTVDWRRLSANAAIGGFHVEGGGTGPSDARGSLAVWTTDRSSAVPTRLFASASVPTGDVDAGRSMGHVMVAAGAAAEHHHDRVHGDLALVYARAIGDGAEHAAHRHGAASWPLIDPMNAEEVSVAGGVTVATGVSTLAARGQALVAEPIGTGERRAIATGGLAWTRGRYHLWASASVPALGTTLIGSTQVELTYHY